MWWKDAKIYELYIDKFAGTIANLTEHLDYFEKLGINVLHILPHYPSPMVDGGYDVMDYLNVRPELGTLEDFEKLIEEAHRRGIHIMVDFVLNHVSEHHPWFLEARSSKDNHKRDYFLWSETGNEHATAWNAFPGIKERNWIWNEATQDYFYATFYPQQPDLNWDNSEVVESMLANMDFWADRGVDGFRLDAALTLIKRDGTVSRGLPETHAVLKHIRAHLDAKYNGTIALLAEAHLEVEEIKKFFGDGDECHLVYHFPLAERLPFALVRKDPSLLEDILTRSENIPPGCEWAVFVRNHDELSLATLLESERAELLAAFNAPPEYLFNKGTAAALRIADMFRHDPDCIRDMIALLYTMPGVPILYYGDEIGMRNMPENGAIDAREYVRGPFDWHEARRAIEDPNSLWHQIAHIIRNKPSSLHRLIARIFGFPLTDAEETIPPTQQQ